MQASYWLGLHRLPRRVVVVGLVLYLGQLAIQNKVYQGSVETTPAISHCHLPLIVVAVVVVVVFVFCIVQFFPCLVSTGWVVFSCSRRQQVCSQNMANRR